MCIVPLPLPPPPLQGEGPVPILGGVGLYLSDVDQNEKFLMQVGLYGMIMNTVDRPLVWKPPIHYFMNLVIVTLFMRVV